MDHDFGVAGAIGSRFVLKTSASTERDFFAWASLGPRLLPPRFGWAVCGAEGLSFVFSPGVAVRCRACRSCGKRPSLVDDRLAKEPKEPAALPANAPGKDPGFGGLSPPASLQRSAVVEKCRGGNGHSWAGRFDRGRAAETGASRGPVCRVDVPKSCCRHDAQTNVWPRACWGTRLLVKALVTVTYMVHGTYLQRSSLQHRRGLCRRGVREVPVDIARCSA